MINFFIRRSIKKNRLLVKRDRTFDNFDKILTIIIFFEISDYENAVLLCKLLESLNKKVVLFGFNNQKIQPSVPTNINIYSKKETNSFGFPNKHVLEKFQLFNKHTDLCINLSDSNCLFISYLCSLSNAKLKIGIHEDSFKLYDFVVNVQKNVDSKFLSQQILFYLRKLKSERLRVVL